MKPPLVSGDCDQIVASDNFTVSIVFNLLSDHLTHSVVSCFRCMYMYHATQSIQRTSNDIMYGTRIRNLEIACNRFFAKIMVDVTGLLLGRDPQGVIFLDLSDH